MVPEGDVNGKNPKAKVVLVTPVSGGARPTEPLVDTGDVAQPYIQVRVRRVPQIWK
jgi:hypothetical protein